MLSPVFGTACCSCVSSLYNILAVPAPVLVQSLGSACAAPVNNILQMPAPVFVQSFSSACAPVLLCSCVYNVLQMPAPVLVQSFSSVCAACADPVHCFANACHLCLYKVLAVLVLLLCTKPETPIFCPLFQLWQTPCFTISLPQISFGHHSNYFEYHIPDLWWDIWWDIISRI